jgi:subtilase family protein
MLATDMGRMISKRLARLGLGLLAAALTLGPGVWAATAAGAGIGGVRLLDPPGQTTPATPVCGAPAEPGRAECLSNVVTDGNGAPRADRTPTGYGPAEFHGAYDLPTEANEPQTIAIVDAYDNPTIADDLNRYSNYYGLPKCKRSNPCFEKVNQRGDAGPLPETNTAWSLEIALDVEMAHQTCQNCKILLVEADSNQFSDLGAAVETAARLGADVISNSYGGAEQPDDSAYDHPGVAVVASSGDRGFRGFGYPASSPNVVAVGGTTLSLSGTGYAGEVAWSGAGSGCSGIYDAPQWQLTEPTWLLTGCLTNRGIADVAADADPGTGAAVYTATGFFGLSGWFQVGGTSVAAPIVAGVYALAGNASSADYPASIVYGSDRSGLHDVTSGSNGACSQVFTAICQAGPGYDGPTGLGTPKGIGAF